MATPKVGKKVPAFSAASTGGPVSSKDLAGSPYVLYFYPKDDTPGCTTQACSLRDAWPDFSGKAVVFGVSPDSAASHAKFIKKHSLPFPLLADDGRKIVEAYGVWVEKSMYGKKYMGTERSTFVIGGDGKLKAVLRKVKPAKHVTLLKAAL